MIANHKLFEVLGLEDFVLITGSLILAKKLYNKYKEDKTLEKYGKKPTIDWSDTISNAIDNLSTHSLKK